MQAAVEGTQISAAEHLFHLADTATQAVTDPERGLGFIQAHIRLLSARRDQLRDEFERSQLYLQRQQQPAERINANSQVNTASLDATLQHKYLAETLRATQAQYEIWVLIKHLHLEEIHRSNTKSDTPALDGILEDSRVKAIDAQLRRIQTVLCWLEEIAPPAKPELPDLSKQRSIAKLSQMRNDAAKKPPGMLNQGITAVASLDPDTALRMSSVVQPSSLTSQLDQYDILQEAKFGELLWSQFRKGAAQLATQLCEQSNQLWRAIELFDVDQWTESWMPSHPSLHTPDLNALLRDVNVYSRDRANNDKKGILRTLSTANNVSPAERALYAVLAGFRMPPSEGEVASQTTSEAIQRQFEACLATAIVPCKTWSDVAWVVFRLLRDELVRNRVEMILSLANKGSSIVSSSSDAETHQQEISVAKRRAARVDEILATGGVMAPSDMAANNSMEARRITPRKHGVPDPLKSIDSALDFISQQAQSKLQQTASSTSVDTYLRIVQLAIAGACDRDFSVAGTNSLRARRLLEELLSEVATNGGLLQEIHQGGIRTDEESPNSMPKPALQGSLKTPVAGARTQSMFSPQVSSSAAPATGRRRTFMAPSTAKKQQPGRSDGDMLASPAQPSGDASKGLGLQAVYDPFFTFAVHLILYLNPAAPNNADLDESMADLVQHLASHLISLGVLDAAPAYIQLLPVDRLIDTYANSLLASLASPDRIYFIQAGAEVYPRLRTHMLAITKCLVGGVLAKENSALLESLMSAATSATNAPSRFQVQQESMRYGQPVSSESSAKATDDVHSSKQLQVPTPQRALIYRESTPAQPKPAKPTGPATALQLVFDEDSVLYTCPMIVDDESGDTNVINPRATEQTLIDAALALFNSLTESEQRCVEAVDSFDLERFGELTVQVKKFLANQLEVTEETQFWGISKADAALLYEALLHVNCLFRRLIWVDSLPAARFLAFRTASLIQLAELVMTDVVNALTEPRLRRMELVRNMSDEEVEAMGNATREVLAWRNFLLCTHMFQVWAQHHAAKPLPIGLPDDVTTTVHSGKSRAERLEELDEQYVEWAKVDRANVEALYACVAEAVTMSGGWLRDVKLPYSSVEIPQERVEELHVVRGKVIPLMTLMLAKACTGSLCVDLCESLTVLVASEENQLYTTFSKEEMVEFVKLLSDVQRQKLLVSGSALALT